MSKYLRKSTRIVEAETTKFKAAEKENPIDYADTSSRKEIEDAIEKKKWATRKKTSTRWQGNKSILTMEEKLDWQLP